MTSQRAILARLVFRGAITILAGCSQACTPVPSASHQSELGYPADEPPQGYIGTPTQSPEEAATILADEATVAARITPLPPVTLEMAPTGIYDDMYVKAEWKKLGFIVQNAWFGLDSGRYVGVYAGALANDPQQGALELLVTLEDRTVTGEFLTPEKHGSLKVVEETNNRLTIEAEDGTRFYFDVPGRRFAISMDERVPSATVPPTYTAIPTPDFAQLATDRAVGPTGYPGVP